MVHTINANELKALIKTHPLAETVFRSLMKRERTREMMDLRRLRNRIIDEEGIAVDRTQFKDLFIDLQRKGYGKLIIGKGQDPDRFKWNNNFIQMGKEALGMGTPHSTHPPAPMVRHAISLAQGIHSPPAPGTIRITYPLRGELVYLDVPNDITKAEAEGLADLIRRFGR
jgi:hypothetical protein